ncbi:MAG: RuBisCO large subunit C-terminal-like domain-containing protein [Sphaerochaeta sp.]
MNNFTLPFCRSEQLLGDFIIATYRISGLTFESIMEKVGKFAVGQSIGTWVQVPGVSPSMVENYQARVISLVSSSEEISDFPMTFLIRIAFPSANFGKSMTMLMTALVGNDVSTALQVKLLDLEFVGSAIKDFSSPKKGIKEIRALAHVEEQRPLLLNMIKPCAGFSPEEGANLFLQVALGGVDLIKDDELLGSPSYNLVAQRTKLYLAAADRAYEVTGKRTVYMPNISGTPSQVMDNAKAILDCGAKACLVNYVFGGLDMLRELTDAYGDDLFVMGHYAGVASFDHPNSGISNPVFIGLLPRLCGASAMMTMFPNRKDSGALFNFYRTIQYQQLPIPTVRPLVPTVGGGITPINQVFIQDTIGKDTIIGIGGAIQGHPMGTEIGAKTAMAAIEATAKGISLQEASVGNPGLQVALEIWN